MLLLLLFIFLFFIVRIKLKEILLKKHVLFQLFPSSYIYIYMCVCARARAGPCAFACFSNAKGHMSFL
jgi:hypothetical protein